MSISLRMLLTADGKQAIAETKNVQQAVKATAASVQSVGTAAKITSADLNKYQGQIDLASAKMTKLRTAQLGASLSSRQMATANRLAAGSVGNLAAQWNDLFVTIQSGQPSAQIALQQGTQITQVIGPLGAAGAVKALKTSFASLINPVSLVTLGVIFAGSALAQWAFSAGEVDETVEELTKSLEALEDRTQKATDKLAVMRQGLKSIAELRVTENIERLEAERDALVARAATISPRSGLRQSTDDQAAAVQREIEALERTIELEREAEAAVQRRQALDGRIFAAYQAYGVTRLRSETDIRAAIEQQYQLYAQTRTEGEAVAAVQRQSLIELQNQAQLRSVIAAEGAGSLEVANQRLRVERENYQAQLASSEASETMKTQLLAAFDAAKGIAGVDVAGNIILAADAANTLARNLARAAEGRRTLTASRDNPDFFDERNESGLAGETDPNRYNVPLGLPGVTLPSNPRASGGGGGGGGGGTQREADAVQNLVDRLQQQLDVLRETDPVQKEMIRNRETLANATEGQKQKIEGLITQHQLETAQLEQKRAVWDTLNTAAGNVLDSLFDKSKSLGDVLKETLVNLLDVLSQSNRLGGGGGGGLLGILFPSLIPARANGGMVYGPGGPRDDKVMVAMSNGEMAINAKATARHRGLLEMINAGAPIPRLANGGYVGGGSGSGGAIGAGAAQVIEFNATINVQGAVGDRDLQDRARRGTEEALRDFSREVLPDRVAEINSDPRMVG